LVRAAQPWRWAFILITFHESGGSRDTRVDPSLVA
jgi:hypothetical protein